MKIVILMILLCLSASLSANQLPMPAELVENKTIIDIKQFGAKGDGKTDDTQAIQNILDRFFPKYSQKGINHFYKRCDYPVLFIPKGEYRITRTLDLSFRNDLTLICFGTIVWDGPINGTVIEAKCSSRCKFYGLKIDGKGKAGRFIHISGNGTADGKPKWTNKLRGKGNVSSNAFVDCWFGWQWEESKFAMVDSIPYPEDTPHSWYYSMDDSFFDRCYFQTTGKYGFAFAQGSSEIGFVQCNISTPNGIDLHSSATVKLYKTVFSLQADDKAALYCRPGAHIAEISMYSCYLENTTAPLVGFDENAPKGSIKAINIYGGLYAQKKNAKHFIYIPKGTPGVINIDNPRFQEKVGKIFAPDCIVYIKRIATGTHYYKDFLVDILAKKIIGFQAEAYTGKIIQYSPQSQDITIHVKDNADINDFSFDSIDQAILSTASTEQGRITIVLERPAIIEKSHTIRADLRITTYRKDRPTLTLKGKLKVYGNGNLTIDNLTLKSVSDKPIINEGGNIFINTVDVLSDKPENSLVLPSKGLTNFAVINLISGSLADASYKYGQGKVILRDIFLKSPNIRPVKLPADTIGNISVLYYTNTLPKKGIWDAGIRIINTSFTNDVREWLRVKTKDSFKWYPITMFHK